MSRRRWTGACRATPPGCAWCASAPGDAAMIFEDEPVPGYPLPILPGHTSPGRFERVLRAGHVCGDQRAGAAGFGGSGRGVPARPHLRWLRGRHQRHRRLGRQLPYVEPGRVRAADARGLRAGDADLLPRQEPHRHPGRHPRRRRHGRVQPPVPDRGRRAGGRSPAGAAGVRSGLDVAFGDGTDAARRASISSPAARSPTRRGCCSGRRRTPSPARWSGAPRGSPRRWPPARSSSRPSTATTCRC